MQISEAKNQAEAEFRYTLTRIRENGESIALLGGEEEERDGIDRTFANVLRVKRTADARSALRAAIQQMPHIESIRAKGSGPGIITGEAKMP